MKSKILNKNDKLLVTQEFLEHLVKVGNNSKMSNCIWKLGDIAKVDKLSDYSTVRVYRGIWSIWIDNNLAEQMRTEFLEKTS